MDVSDRFHQIRITFYGKAREPFLEDRSHMPVLAVEPGRIARAEPVRGPLERREVLSLHHEMDMVVHEAPCRDLDRLVAMPCSIVQITEETDPVIIVLEQRPSPRSAHRHMVPTALRSLPCAPCHLSHPPPFRLIWQLRGAFYANPIAPSPMG